MFQLTDFELKQTFLKIFLFICGFARTNAQCKHLPHDMISEVDCINKPFTSVYLCLMQALLPAENWKVHSVVWFLGEYN